MLFQAGCSPSRNIEALIVLGDIAAGSGPSRLKNKTAAPIRATIRYIFEGGEYTADVYWPGGDNAAKAVLVLVPGVVRLGKDDPRLIAFANTLARSRFLVFVPDLVNLRRLNVSSEDAANLSGAVRYAAFRSGVGKDGSIGMVAFSYAAGPALLAAMAEETRHNIRFVYAVGPYFSLEMVVTYLTTGHYRQNADSQWAVSAPSPYAIWVFVHSCAAWLEDPGDRRILTAIADAKLADPDAEVSDLLAGLGPEGRYVYDLLGNSDPEKVPGLIAGLPAPLLSELRALDLSAHDLGDLKARIILIHGRDDRLIPHTESMALASALASGRASLSVIDNLEHVELRSTSISDAFKLWQAVRTLLEERDRMPRPTWRIDDPADP